MACSSWFQNKLCRPVDPSMSILFFKESVAFYSHKSFNLTLLFFLLYYPYFIFHTFSPDTWLSPVLIVRRLNESMWTLLIIAEKAKPSKAEMGFDKSNLNT